MNQTISLSVRDLPFHSGGGRLKNTLLFRRDPVAFMQSLCGGGDLFRIPLVDRNVVVATGPRAIQQLLVDNAGSLEKAALLRYLLYPILGEGLLTSRGDLWRRQRRLMAPIFQPAQLAQLADSMVACAQRDVDTWRDGAQLDMLRETTRITMSVAGRTLFGAETFSEADELGAALTVAMQWVGGGLGRTLPFAQMALRGWLVELANRLPGRASTLSLALAERLNGPLLLVSERDRRMQAAVELLHERVQRMIDERRASGQLQADLLGRLLSAQDEGQKAPMTDTQVRDEALTLFLAGHETTASSLAWALYLLVRHPEIYRQVRAEADALTQAPRYEDLPRLALTQRVFKETIRLYPPLPAFNRDTTAALTVCGYTLPPGTVVIICPYATHHRPDLWPQPERFDPDRFTPAGEAGRSRYAYLPFSAGPRICIGNHFALMEGTLVLATLLQRADFELLGGEIQPVSLGTLRPQGGVPMRIRLRQAAARRELATSSAAHQ